MFSKKGKVVASLLALTAVILLPVISSAAQDKTDAATCTGFQQLRNKLSLTTRDLAAMGCNKGQVETILKKLLAWYKANKASITSVEKTTQNNMNKKGQALKSAKRSKAYVQAAISIETSIPPEKRTTWKTAQYNSQGIEKYRYVPALSCRQLLDLKALIRTGNYKDEVNLLTTAQVRAKTAAEANISRCLAGVREAEAVVLKISRNLKNKQPTVSARKNLKSE